MRKPHLFFTMLLAVFCLTTPTGNPAVIQVPAQYPTIGDALSKAMDGDTVLVAPGVYMENIRFNGKAVTIMSSKGPDTTIIDGGDPVNPLLGSVVTFDSQEGPDSVLDGFTITNGKGSWVFSSFNGGGILCLDSSPTLLNNIIKENVISSPHGVFGGGIFCYGNPRIEHNTLRANSAVNGGGICCWGASPLILNNTIEGNAALIDGGGIDCRGGTSPVIRSNLVRDNAAYGLGAGISCLEGASPTITNNTILENTNGTNAGPGWGGGIGCHVAAPTIAGNLITRNSATRAGGAIFSKDCSAGYPVIEGNILSENTADMRGGALMISLCESLVLVNNIISRNRAPYGGGIHYTNSILSYLTNNTLYENSDLNGSGKGGGISCDLNASLWVTNSILYNNTAGSGPEIYIAGTGTPSKVTISYSNVKGGQASSNVEPGCTLDWGTGMIDVDSLFVDGTSGDLHIRYLSLCRNSGDTAAPGLPDKDIDGNPRIVERHVDMGADEFSPHLYYTGDATPGGNIQFKVIGLPGTAPVGLFYSEVALDPPLPSMWGDWYLNFPVTGPVMLGTIPQGGILVFPGSLPKVPAGPDLIPMQALIGDALSNLCTLKIR